MRSKAERIHQSSVNIEFLTVGNLERLVRPIFHSQNHGIRRVHIPDLPRNRLDSSDGLWSRRGCDRSLQFHAGLQVMDAQLLAVDGNSGAFGKRSGNAGWYRPPFSPPDRYLQQ